MTYRLWFLAQGGALSFCIVARFEWKHYEQKDFDEGCEVLAKQLNAEFLYAESEDQA